MAVRAQGLSARRVETVKTPGLFGDGGGLYLQVTAAGAKSWIFRYMIAGRRRDMGLGSTALVSLAEARDAALAARRQVAAGIDPIEARRAEKAAAQAAMATEAVPAGPTFRVAAEALIEARRPAWRNAKHADQWASTLATYAYPSLGDRAADAIDTEAVLAVLEPIWTIKSETATRLRGRIEAVLDYARVRGWRQGENPARWKGHLDHLLPAPSKVAIVRHHASLPYTELPAFMLLLQAQDGLGARALELAILTACRTSEVLGARWSEIDLEEAVWTVPAARMKAGREHRVPLSPAAVALLRRLKTIRRDDYVFSGQRKGRPLSSMAMAMVLRRIEMPVTAHGFRATFRTWAEEKTDVQNAVAEAALAHVTGDKTHLAYQRGDLLEKRRDLMAAWAAYCLSGAVGKPLVRTRS